MTEQLSNRAINRAGDVLRSVGRGPPIDREKEVEAWSTLYRFRGEWAEWPNPLTKVGMGLRSMVRTATSGNGRVSQRLKRAERIVDKLKRFPRMNLAQMHDIGGCRVVLPNKAELMQLRACIHRQWASSIADEDDYIAEPRPSGYRAIHVVVERDGHLVEIQLRTTRQHRWAASVEFVEQRGPGWLRDTDDQHSLTNAFRDLGRAFELRDNGEPVPPELHEKLKRWLGVLDVGG